MIAFYIDFALQGASFFHLDIMQTQTDCFANPKRDYQTCGGLANKKLVFQTNTELFSIISPTQHTQTVLQTQQLAQQ